MAWTTGAWLVGAAAAAALTYVVMNLTTRFLRVRSAELAAARESLERYEQSLDALLTDPATPDSLREFVLGFDRAVGDRAVAYWLATGIFRDGSKWLDENDSPSEAILAGRALRSHRPDLHQAWVNIVYHGFRTIMLRWPVSAVAFKLIIVHPKQDPDTPARAVICAADLAHHHHGHALAAAA